jgi:glucose/arabinose dehydrogenase
MCVQGSPPGLPPLTPGGRARGRRIGPWLIPVLLLGAPRAARAQEPSLPEGFRDAVVFSGLVRPTAVRFSRDGRAFVAEKSGLIKVFNGLDDPSPDVVADLRTNVHDFWDRGLLGLALDPDFPARPFLYVLYTYDAEIGGTAPRWGDSCPNPPGATGDGCVVSGRLSRLMVGTDNRLLGSELPLIENHWCQQYPSHSVGGLVFGPEGALYVSAGDGASFNFVDYGQGGGGPESPIPRNPCGDPPAGAGGAQSPPLAEGGALRSQDLRTPNDPVTLDGAILRVDPATGEAWPSNPLAGGDPEDDRIIAFGFRNPFRLTLRPGSDEVWIGDVGWFTWEEIDRLAAPDVSPVRNFGWPCYEGTSRQGGYDSADLAICEGLYTADPQATVAPFYSYGHDSHVGPGGDRCGTGGASVAGLAFYPGGSYPAEYDGALFFADYTRRCIYVMRRGGDGELDPGTRDAFDANAAGPVDLQAGPGGDIYYVDFDGGTIRRIEHFALNHPPVAVARADPAAGPEPLTVRFDGSGSSDPDPGTTLFYAWDLDGDGLFDDSTQAAPEFTYTAPGTYVVGLRVSDDDGATAVDRITVVVGNRPPAATIQTPPATLTWRVGEILTFSGTGVDPDDGPLPSSALRWEVALHHCSANLQSCHEHFLQEFLATDHCVLTAPDHEWFAFLEVTLIATDSRGLSGRADVTLYPRFATLYFETDPTGLELVVGGAAETTPFARPVILGSLSSISAPALQSRDGFLYTWVWWSDGGVRSHEVVAGETPVFCLATYRRCEPVEACDGLDNDCNGITDDAPAPEEPPRLAVDDRRLTWSLSEGASLYEVVSGDLETLRLTAGDFSQATFDCLGHDLLNPTLGHLPQPDPGRGLWYLVRAGNCGGYGTFESSGPGQEGLRTPEIEASPGACQPPPEPVP